MTLKQCLQCKQQFPQQEEKNQGLTYFNNILFTKIPKRLNQSKNVACKKHPFYSKLECLESFFNEKLRKNCALVMLMREATLAPCACWSPWILGPQLYQKNNNISCPFQTGFFLKPISFSQNVKPQEAFHEAFRK